MKEFETAKIQSQQKMAFVNAVLTRIFYQNHVPNYLSVDGQNIISQLEMTKNLMNFSQLLVVILRPSYQRQILTC